MILHALKSLIFPPGIFILIFFILSIGALFYKRKRLGLLLLITTLGFYFSSNKIGVYLLYRYALNGPLVTVDASDSLSAGAIVVLTGGRLRDAMEYNGETINQSSMLRARYAAYLHRKTNLPILITGGTPLGETKSEAELMANVLVNEFQVPVKWLEINSKNTYEHGIFCSSILNKQDINEILLVTNATHIPRAVKVFESHGFKVIPAPTKLFYRPDLYDVLTWLPETSELGNTQAILYELVGSLWYKV